MEPSYKPVKQPVKQRKTGGQRLIAGPALILSYFPGMSKTDLRPPTIKLIGDAGGITFLQSTNHRIARPSRRTSGGFLPRNSWLCRSYNPFEKGDSYA